MSIEPATILVVDDNKDNRDLLVRQLQKQGHRADAVEDGRQALDAMRHQAYDLILLDIMMPEMDGYQVLEAIKADDDLRHVPVIVISAVDEIAGIVRCIELGAEDHLPKPFPRVLLKARIGAALEKKRWRDQERSYLRTIEATNAAKSRFITTMAHELKNTITPIQGYLDLLLREAFGSVTEAQAGILRIMATSAERTTALVADLSDISRIEAGHLLLDFQPTFVDKIVTDVVEAMRAQTGAKGQTVTISLPDDLPAVWADDVRLAQVLTNLLSNAQKYTPQGGEIRIWADVTANGQEDAGASQVVHVAIEDTGIGIAAEEQDQVFEAFFRSSDTAVYQTPGIGLGLNITKNLVELQGGEIWFESEQGKGTTFHFTVPAVEASGAEHPALG
ncbi:MAG: hybrid sensor histidine kinase/response regulator [Anaerolineae bacterium]|jgi:signal transduction histidine kinase